MTPESPTTLRASNADREQVAKLLTRAYAEGRLEQEMLEQRLAEAYRAPTVGDLDKLLADLPFRVERPSMEMVRATPEVVTVTQRACGASPQTDARNTRRELVILVILGIVVTLVGGLNGMLRQKEEDQAAQVAAQRAYADVSAHFLTARSYRGLNGDFLARIVHQAA